MKIKLNKIQSTISLAPLSNKDLTLGLKEEYLWRENILPFLPGYIPSVSANNSQKVFVSSSGAHVIHFDIVGFHLWDFTSCSF